MYYYVYRITKIAEKKHYYGKRASKIEPKKDLGVKYFSSSTNLAFIQEQKDNPSSFKYKIVKVCTTLKEAIELEIKLHTKFNVGVHASFYNKAKQTSTGFDTTGIKLPQERIEQIKSTLTGRVMSNETKNKIKESKRHLSIESRFAMGKANRGKHLTEEVKKKISNKNKGKVWTEDKKQAKSVSMTGAGNTRAKLVNIYTYPGDECIATNVIATIWCKDTKYTSNMLLQTLKRDVNKPYSFATKKDTYNPLHYKGLYVKLAV